MYQKSDFEVLLTGVVRDEIRRALGLDSKTFKLDHVFISVEVKE